ncbi:ABC transporter permease [Allomeiothermus silvanus]|uniref:ABC transporter permease n=1 Tax=Allomeiothermus silvanus TaxID=52022 RepID=UPI0023F03E2E|nr:ABC transporter permease [Allomeiothermus silvanus]
MATYLAQRLLQSLGVLVAVSVITFSLLYVLPADPARLVAGRSATQDVVERVRHELGLDRPLLQRYLGYLGGVLRGDLGRSYLQKTRVRELLGSRLVPTLQLTLAGVMCELLIGIPAGIIAALRRGTWLDQGIMLGAFTGVAAPQFALGLLLLYVLAYKLPLFPLGGYGGLEHLILPALVLGLAGGGWYARIMRSSLLEVLAQDYVRTARAKGLAGRVVVYKHALRNALLPVVAMVGTDLGTFMGGVVVVESVFGWPGIGQLTWQAIQAVDIPVILGAVTFTAFFIVLANLMADLAYPLLDPRVQYR